MDNRNRPDNDACQTDSPSEPETNQLTADARRLWEIREQVRLDSERSAIQRAWDSLLGPSRDR